MNYNNFFHKIHNILRNGEAALTGMAALNEINNFILLIFIELQIDKLFGKDSNNKFSYLIKKYIDVANHTNAVINRVSLHVYENISIYAENKRISPYTYALCLNKALNIPNITPIKIIFKNFDAQNTDSPVNFAVRNISVG